MILVDTGPLVALCDARDSKHRTAVKHLETIIDTGLRVHDAVLTEAVFHLPHTVQRQRLSALLEALDIQPFAMADEHAFRDQVFVWMRKYADHEPDWADACLAVISGHDSRVKVWTYDREFRTTWRRPNGSAIPMAVR